MAETMKDFFNILRKLGLEMGVILKAASFSAAFF
jgi:hypothetical protein